MKPYFIFILTSFSLILWLGCREIYEPDIAQEDLEVLVVEGHIEVDGGTSEVRLSYSSPLTAGPMGFRQVNQAEVTVISKDETGEEQTYTMYPSEPGYYRLEGTLPAHLQYKLQISIPEKGQYSSNWISPVISPPVSEVGFIQNEDTDVEIFVTTRGNETAQYFIWNFSETWIFNTPLASYLKYERLSETKDTILYRTADEMTNECFLSENSDEIILGTSEQFKDHLVHQKKLQLIPNGSEKLGRRYSILVRQRAIPEEAYEFYEILRKNSDDIGGIFSPLPSVMTTNIQHQDSPDQKVIGFVTAGQSTEKRIFIGRHEIFSWRVTIPYYAGCEYSVDTVLLRDVRQVFGTYGRVPLSGIEGPGGINGYIGYLSAPVKCTDCTLRGTKEKPDFWEN